MLIPAERLDRRRDRTCRGYVDEEDWLIRHIIVETPNWLIPRRVLIEPDWVSPVDWLEGKLRVRVTREQVKGSTEHVRGHYGPSIRTSSSSSPLPKRTAMRLQHPNPPEPPVRVPPDKDVPDPMDPTRRNPERRLPPDKTPVPAHEPGQSGGRLCAAVEANGP